MTLDGGVRGEVIGKGNGEKRRSVSKVGTRKPKRNKGKQGTRVQFETGPGGMKDSEGQQELRENRFTPLIV